MTIGSARDGIVSRYSRLARAAIAGDTITDCDGDASEDGCFGAAAYADDPAAPDTALRASLGCGNPVAVADIRPGETVLDLGSGGGLDVLLSARRTGPQGIAYGLDASADMLALARANAAQAGAANAQFLHGHIEDIPLPGDHVDVVISNCGINLSADKPRVLAEAFRVLRPGGRLGVSDVIADDTAEQTRRAAAERRAGCLSGTLTRREYHDLLAAAGFTPHSHHRHPASRRGPALSNHPGGQASHPGASAMHIEPMTDSHAGAVLAIYQAGIDEGNATFETSAPPWAAFTAARLPAHRYIATEHGTILGWAAVSAVSGRCVYNGVVEDSVYVTPDARGLGIGRLLLEALIASTEAAGIWTIQSSIFPENTASLALHHSAGFRDVGIRERIGRHHGRWRDTIFVERRSPAI